MTVRRRSVAGGGPDWRVMRLDAAIGLQAFGMISVAPNAFCRVEDALGDAQQAAALRRKRTGRQAKSSQAKLRRMRAKRRRPTLRKTSESCGAPLLCTPASPALSVLCHHL